MHLNELFKKLLHHNRSSDVLGKRSWISRINFFMPYLIALSILCGLLGGFRLTPTESLDNTVLDFAVLDVELNQPEEDVYIILISDESLRLMDTSWPIDRSYHAQLVSGPLAKAKVIVFDILFYDAEESSSAADHMTSTERFASAIASHGNVILARSKDKPLNLNLTLSASMIGSANAIIDDDGISRKYEFYSPTPSIAAAVMQARGYRIDGIDPNGAIISLSDANSPISDYLITAPNGDSHIFTCDNDGSFYRVPINRDQSLGRIHIIGYADVYNGKYDPSVFEGATVFIGGSVSGNQDLVYASDFVRDEASGEYSGKTSCSVNGTKYIADSYITAASGFSPQRVSPVIEGILCTLLFLTIAYLTSRFSIKISWIFLLILSLGWSLLARLFFTSGLFIISTAAPLLSMCIAYLSVLILTLIVAIREWRISSVPSDALYRLSSELGSIDTESSFGCYLERYSEHISDSTGAVIVRAQTLSDDPIFSSVELPKPGSSRAITVKSAESTELFGGKTTLLIIPLPHFDDDKPQEYTVLAAKKASSQNWKSSVTALILAIYVFYQAEKKSREKQQAVFSMISVIISLIDAKDPITAGHSKRVSEMSGKLAKWLGYSPERIRDIELAGLLHDIGKVGVDDSVLNKPGLFTSRDMAKMHEHPQKGVQIVENVGLSDEIVDGISHHHENYSGSGYPDGTASNNFSEFSRIIKVADVYDALISKRQYKRSWSLSQTLNTIHKGIGTEFDPHIAETFINNMKPDGWEPDPESISMASAEFVTTACRIAIELTDKYDPCVKLHGTRLTSIGDVKADRSSFCGFEWGLLFSDNEILSKHPAVIECEGNDLITAWRTTGVSNTLSCYFRKGCLCAGWLCINSDGAESINSQMEQTHGKKQETEGIEYWLGRKHIALPFTINGEYIIVFVTNYICNEL
ncbi:MAG: CHASE2 domain-containing protein [Clostridia bacterium]|nr:CHASE2 domain-containing protein [Clostridia bacterium]